jgi:deoxyadenosine/deoxycytidine kinase
LILDIIIFQNIYKKNILTLLHNLYNRDFPYNPDTILGGFSSEFYIGKLYELLNIKYKMFDYFVKDDTLVYSYLNSEYNIQKYNVEDNRLYLNFDYDELIKMNEDFLLPDLTILINVSPEECIKRIEKRGETKELFERKEKNTF